MTKQSETQKIRVGVNGYGVIGKRVSAGVRLQPDMTLVGVADVFDDWRLAEVARHGLDLYGATDEAVARMSSRGVVPVRGSLDELVSGVDVVVDCTPKGIGAKNAERYRTAGTKFIVQGGEKHEVAGHSFVADANYEEAVGLDATRVVSCNTTSIVRTLSRLDQNFGVSLARGTLLRRATDPWESHLGGIMNTLVPALDVPSHQTPDARRVLPGLKLTTVAIKVPETLAHMHVWYVTLHKAVSREAVLESLNGSSRIMSIEASNGLGALNSVKEFMLDIGRPHGNLYEVALWADLLRISDTELCYSYMVDNQAIVVPENIDAIRALAGQTSGLESMALTDATLGIGEFTA